MKKLRKLSVLKLEKKETKEILGGNCYSCTGGSCSSCPIFTNSSGFNGSEYNRVNNNFNNN